MNRDGVINDLLDCTVEPADDNQTGMPFSFVLKSKTSVKFACILSNLLEAFQNEESLHVLYRQFQKFGDMGALFKCLLSRIHPGHARQFRGSTE